MNCKVLTLSFGWLCKLSIILLFLLCSCATDSTKAENYSRPSTDPESVKVFSQEPLKYETLGVVKASCDAAITEKECRDEAIAKLRKDAARLGANGVTAITFTAVSKDSNVSAIFRAGFLYSVPMIKVYVSGTAVYVVEE